VSETQQGESGLTPAQRRTVIGLAILVVIVFAALAGFVVNSTRSLQRLVPTPAPPPTDQPPSPTPAPPTDTPAAPTTDDAVLPQVRAARLFEQIAHQVETLRGLSPSAEVPLSFLDEPDMAELLRSQHLARGPQLRVLPQALLDLLPEATPVLNARPVAAVYAWEQRQIFMTVSAGEHNTDDQALMARAYAQALVDQRFNLSAMDARATTTDARLAMDALEAGDGLLLMALYRGQDPVSADWDALVALAQRDLPTYGPDIEAAPAWSRLRDFPYREGRAFAQALFEAEGWEAINRAYSDPPRSTEQVLHPERYLGARDEPSWITLPDLRRTLGPGWTLVAQDTLGEFVFGLYLEQTLSGHLAWRAADGWDGDLFAVWGNEDGGRVLIWRTVWDHPSEASEAEWALTALIPHRYGPTAALEPLAGHTGHWWLGDEATGAFAVYRLARYVTMVQAPNAQMLAQVVEALP